MWEVPNKEFKMRKILLILTLLVYGLLFSQENENRFQDAENRFQQSESVEYREAVDDDNYYSPQSLDPGDPPGEDDPEPVPIDDYIPVLLFGAFGIIVYVAYRKKRNLL